MKETLEDLKTRRSCRKYQHKQIKPEELNAILKRENTHRQAWGDNLQSWL